jgi:UDP-glucuronate 4-epimerase
MKVAVTGGAGFIGSHLCERLLRDGTEVICIDNFNDSYDPCIKRSNLDFCGRCSNFRLIEGSILDTGLIDLVMAMESPEAVVHLAALAGVRDSISNPLDYIDTDVKGTAVMLEACRKSGAGKFIFASSSSVYGNAPTPFREDAYPLLQVSPYASAKYAGELFCRTYNHLYGIPVVCLRFFTVYGPRQRPDMAVYKFTRAVAEERDIDIYGSGSSFRDYTYVDDIVDGIISSISLTCGYEVINLGNSTTTGILDLVAIIEEKLNKKARLNFMPDQPGDVPATRADISKAETLLGYKPKVTLDEGIGRFAEWYMKNCM